MSDINGMVRGRHEEGSALSGEDGGRPGERVEELVFAEAREDGGRSVDGRAAAKPCGCPKRQAWRAPHFQCHKRTM